MKPFVSLGLAIAAELVGTAALKASDGFTRLVPSALMVAAYAATFYLMSLTIRLLPLGFVYAVWSGVGTVGAVLIGVLIWREALNATGMIGIGLVVAGIVLLNLSGAVH